MKTALEVSISREEDDRKFWDSCVLTMLSGDNSMSPSTITQWANLLLDGRQDKFKRKVNAQA